MRLIACLLVCLGLGSAVAAQCAGKDLRASLSARDLAEVQEIVANSPFATGNRWRAERQDQVIDLVGTVHIPDPRLEGPAARLASTVAGAEVVLVEMDAAEQARMTADLARDPGMLLLQDATLPELMDEEAWQTLATAARARGVPAVMAAKFQPWYLSMLLSIPPCAANALQQAQGLDGRIMDMAENAGVPTRSLETYDTVFAMFQDAPLDEQIAMMESALVPPDVSEDMFATLLHGYFDEALTETWEVSRLLSRNLSPLDAETSDAMFAQLETDLLDRRNRAWMPVILDAARAGPVVVAVGGAHLQGEYGLLNLLEAKGFRAEPAAVLSRAHRVSQPAPAPAAAPPPPASGRGSPCRAPRHPPSRRSTG